MSGWDGCLMSSSLARLSFFALSYIRPTSSEPRNGMSVNLDGLPHPSWSLLMQFFPFSFSLNLRLLNHEIKNKIDEQLVFWRNQTKRLNLPEMLTCTNGGSMNGSQMFFMGLSFIKACPSSLLKEITNVRVYARILPKPIEDDVEVPVPEVTASSSSSAVLVPTADRKRLFLNLEQYQRLNPFPVDKCFVGPDEISSRDIFLIVMVPHLLDSLRGRDSCVILYGATGTGKTHTSLGLPNGIVFSTLRELLAHTKQNENFYLSFRADQLSGSRKRDTIFHTKDIGTIDEARRAVEEVASRRTVRTTKRNIASSRSHLIMTIYVRNQYLRSNSVLHIVDLAGSERCEPLSVLQNSMSLEEAKTLQKESIHVNTGLLCLRRVMWAQSDSGTERKKKRHIPYLDSNLTTHLKSSLGGNGIAPAFLLTLSDEPQNAKESFHTLNFGLELSRIRKRVAVSGDADLDKAFQTEWDRRIRLGKVLAELRYLRGVWDAAGNSRAIAPFAPMEGNSSTASGISMRKDPPRHMPRYVRLEAERDELVRLLNGFG